MSDPESSQRRRIAPGFSGGDGSSSMQTHLGPDPFIVGDEPTVISQGPPKLLPQLRPGTHPTELGRLLEGERLGHFELEEFIGGGGMGAVFRALDTMLNRIVAVKVLSSDQATDEDTQRRFKNEAQSAARLDHENIARVHYVGEDRGVHYIVFEYIEGINIRDLVIRDGPLSLADCISFTWQIAQALSHASQRDVVHRDIKPSNVLIMPSGRAKLVDMGLARLHQVEHTENDLTASGVTLGTFDYISPEQARDPRTADVRSDLYSLGCTLYFMLTGRPPFPEGTVLQKLLRHQGDEPPNPAEFRADLPEPVAQATIRLLAKQPDARFQTPDDLIAALGTMCDQLGVPVPEMLRPASLVVEHLKPALPTPRWRKQIARHVPWAGPLLALVLLALGIERFWSPSSEGVTFQSPRPPVREPLPKKDVLPAASLPGPASGKEAPGEKQPVPTPQTVPNPAKPEDASKTTDNTDEPAAAPANDTPPTKPEQKTPAKASPETGEEPAKTSATPASLVSGKTPAAGTGEPKQVPPTDSTSPAPEKTAATNTPAAGDPNPTQVPPERGPMDPLVVDPAGAVGAYSTLEAACAAAKTGDVIELRFDGPLVTRPIKLTNLALTIRAARSKQPRIVFKPGVAEKNPTLHPRSMVTIVGGDLTLVGLQLELELSRELTSENWALLEARGTQSLGIEQCVLTVRNAAEGGGAFHPSVQMIDVKPAAGDAMMRETAGLTGAAGMKLRPVEIRLLNSVVRGEAVFLRSAQMEHVELSWKNGLAAISETLIELAADQTPMRESCRLRADLQHLTIAARRGLLLETNSDDAPFPLEAEFVCKDSIFMIASDGALLEQRCVHPASSLQEMIVWTGERNFFEGFSNFWKIQVLGLNEQSQIPPLTFMAWQTYWHQRPEGYAIQSQLGAVIWKRLPPANQPLHTHSAANYLLGEGVAGNPARRAAKNGEDVGFNFALLPTPTDELTAAFKP